MLYLLFIFLKFVLPFAGFVVFMLSPRGRVVQLIVNIFGGGAAGIFYRNNRKNRYAIKHIGKETKYINLWDYINLRNSSAEGNAR